MATGNQLNIGLKGATGTGSIVGSTSATLITPILGTPTSGNLSNCTALPVGSLTGLGTGIGTALTANANGSGAISLTTSPAFVTPALGTVASGDISACTSTSMTMITPILGTPTSGTLTNCTGLTVPGGGTGKTSFTAWMPVCAGTTTTGVFQSTAAGSSGQMYCCQGVSAVPRWTTSTYPQIGGTSGTLMKSNGTNWGNTVETFATPGSAGNLNISDGTNWINVGSSGSGSMVRVTSATMVTPVLGAASATSLTFSSTSGIIGTTTNNNAAALSVGEFVDSGTAAVTITSSNVGQNITSISLTAGDWEVFSTVASVTTAGQTFAQTSITTSSATIGGGVGAGQAYQTMTAGTTTTLVSSLRMSLASTTTVYLVGYVTWTVTQPGAYGQLTARRLR